MKLIIGEDTAYRNWLCRYLEPDEVIQAGDLKTTTMNPMEKIWDAVTGYNIGLTPEQANDGLEGVRRHTFFRVISRDPLVVQMHRTRQEEECD